MRGMGISQLSLSDYWRIVQKRKRFVIIFLSVVVLTTALYTFTQPKVYKATTQILIERGSRNLLSFADVFSFDTAGGDYSKTQFRVLKSRTVAKKVIAELGLEKKYKGIEFNKSVVQVLLAAK